MLHSNNSIMKNKVLEYFKSKSDKYDLVDNQIYWKFSDSLLWLKTSRILKKLNPNFVFLDAGGGTGRWSFKILKAFPKSRGIIYDLSNDMLDVARKNNTDKSLGGRLKIINGDLENLDIKKIGEKVDISFNFHNVLGFVKNPKNVLKNISSVTKKNGFLISFIPNLYHLLYFNISIGRIDEALYAYRRKIGRFTEEMPYINLFTPDNISNLYNKTGFSVSQLTGFPVALYPGFLETQIEGSSKSLASFLTNKKNFQKLLEMEDKLSENSEVASRGNNIFIVGKK